MRFNKLVLLGAFLSPMLFAHTAEAREYCREYQKSIRVGGQIESGYGTACLQPDGSWMIVSTEGTVDPFDDLRRQRDVIIVSDQRPVYYNYGPTFSPVTYYPRRQQYNSGSSFFFSFGDNDWDRHDNRNWKRKNNRHDRDDWNDRGRGRGRGHH